MKTMIIYTSTYGYTEQCALELSTKLSGQVDIVNAASGVPPTLDGYDTVILGGSIYMGQLNKKLKDYMNTHLIELKTKRLGLFICCGLPENLAQHWTANFPKELLDRAIARECFGGVLDPSKMSFGHKMLTKMMESAAKKERKAAPAALPENIVKLADVMKG